MKQEITLSIMAPRADGIQPILNRFESTTGMHVKLRLLRWDTAWKEFINFSLHGGNPDISEIGSTWIGDLMGMGVLRPFAPNEVQKVKQSANLFNLAWRSVTSQPDGVVWGIPWLAGARLLYYRKQIFSNANISTMKGFTFKEFEKTISTLHQRGVKIPWLAPTGRTHTTLLHIASWVWAAGGDFLSADQNSVRFMEPEALKGMAAYFALSRYLSPEVKHLNGLEPDERFLADPDAAVVVSGPWLMMDAMKRGIDSGLGIALLPGPSFIGGSSLMIWKNSSNAQEALTLAQYLLEPEPQIQYAEQVGLMPVREDLFDQEPYRSDLYWTMASHSMRIGRSFPFFKSWGMIESRLVDGFAAVWSDLLKDPVANPMDVLTAQLAPIAKELNSQLS
ncbi:MAG: extracellular solute-binding protein [Anaerolineaceae bacterium]|nr:extracellular solute-binding protein [Anaerolineaceae bacterium]